jgi:hypothetical protein
VTPAEIVILTRYVRAVCPQQKFDEFTPDAWYDVLAAYDLDDARNAVITHVRQGNSFVSAGEITTGIKTIRAARVTAAHPLYDGQPTETGAQSATNIRALVTAAANGHLPQRPITAALTTNNPPALHGRQLLAIEATTSTLRTIPTRRDGTVNVLAVPCPHCYAQPGHPCTSGTRKRRTHADAHNSRLEDARRTAAGLPPTDHTQAEAATRQRQQAARRAAQHHPSAFVPPTRDDIAS